MIDILARGCPSWAPVKGWQDLGGCWTPPPAASWWTTPHFALAAAVAVLAGVILGAAFAIVRDRSRARRFLLRGAR